MRRLTDQTGSFTLMFAVLTIALLAIAGLVHDGRRQLTAQQRADAVASEAARAAGQEIDGSTLTGSPGLDRVRAVAAARDHLAAAGLSGSVSIDGNRIVVRADATEPAAILPLVGITTLEASGTASADIVTAVTGQPRAAPPDSS
ncbi:pilus assembly protein TadG-related protein [Jiangella anatolica]|uniref:Putative Flp pilus-assembly TadG-like N-terminal domain-containing protein n=1 Tax=Jiangella anatolica TaxID=2670374 RepID=A0A2W2C176_9ACTN|nr:pilus assembly protein TadG-related protein [Jiangella anatolica]PZF86504.1 hypothetical protein C1I92_01485 [Jiangella anatolica]